VIEVKGHGIRFAAVGAGMENEIVHHPQEVEVTVTRLHRLQSFPFAGHSSPVTKGLYRVIRSPELADDAEGAGREMQTLGAIAQSERIGNDAKVAEDAAGGVLNTPQLLRGSDELFALRDEFGRCIAHLWQVQ
jgi:hypothetical protein